MTETTNDEALKAAWAKADKMQAGEDYLALAVNIFAKLNVSRQKIRKMFEEVLSEQELTIQGDVAQENRKIINQYRHYFIDDKQAKERPVEAAYIEAYISNIIDTARGKD